MESSGQGVGEGGVGGVQIKPAVSVSRPLLPGLEDGACVSLSPTSGHVGQTVFIDAGHGGLDPGVVGATAAGNQVLEKEATLAGASRPAGLVRAGGDSVGMARTRDTTVIKPSPADLHSCAT